MRFLQMDFSPGFDGMTDSERWRRWRPNLRCASRLPSSSKALTRVLEGGSRELPGEKLRRLLYMADSHEIVSCAVLNPVLWGSLLRELLVLVLARLLVSKITRLRGQLSKEWTMNMEFNRACDDWNPNMAALLSYARATNEFSVRILDFSKYAWLYEYRFHLTNRENAPSGIESVWTPMAGDGGLVCFVCTGNYEEASPLCIVVINPLTRVQHELPPLQHVYTVPPRLVHMKVDSETKGYKVVVVFNNEDLHKVQTYDSVSREWSRGAPHWGHILGRAREWNIRDGNYFGLRSSSSCAFDLEEGQLELLHCSSLFQSEGAYVMQHVLAGDRVFVLYKEKNRHDIGSRFYSITEFQFQNGAEVWVPVRTHSQCFPEERDYSIDLHACEDVLMLRQHIYSKQQICSFLDFSTSEWHKLPENSLENRYVSLMCRVFWHGIP